MKTKIAVIGAGYWGKNLVRNFYELGHLGVVCDEDETLKSVYSASYPDIPFISDYDKILADKNIDAVVLATPAVTHYNLAREAIMAGKHVFVEKPLALAIKEAKELIAIAEKASRVLMVGHILHYHGAAIKLKELIDAGELGKLQYIYSNRLNMGKIRTEENILWSFAPHDISIILMLLNETPDWIFSSGGNYLQENVADSTMTIMNFASGVKAHIFVSWLHPFKEQKLVVVGDKKMAVFNDTIEDKLLLYPHKIKWQNRVPVASKAEAELVAFEMTEPLKSECRHFIECIQNGQRPSTDGREGLQVLKILNASQHSLDLNGSIIKLDKAADTYSKIKKNNEPSPSTFVHESAYVDKDTSIGDGARIWHFSHVLNGSKIGRNCRIGQNVVIGPKVSIGNGCKIQNNISIYEGVTLEDYVFCGPAMVFTNVFNPRAKIPRMDELRKTLVKKGATLGANCTVICGNTIGSYAFVGAGAVVTSDVPDFALVSGNPAEIKGWMCACGAKLDFEGKQSECSACGALYEQKKDNFIIKLRGKNES